MKFFDPPCRNTEICPPWKSCLECEWRVCVSSTDALVSSIFLFSSTISRQPAGRFTPNFECERILVPDLSPPLLEVSGPQLTEKMEMKFSFYCKSPWEIFAFWRFLSDISATRGRIHTKFYLCRDNVCRRAPSRLGSIGLWRAGEGGGLKTQKMEVVFVRFRLSSWRDFGRLTL